MSSSRRSSRSTKSRKPPVWRSISVSKKSSPPSVSLIFAEPEQGAPLASATTKLPAPRAAISSDSGSLYELPDQSHDPMASTSNLREELRDGEVVATEGDTAGSSKVATIKESVQSLSMNHRIDDVAETAVSCPDTHVVNAPPQPAAAPEHSQISPEPTLRVESNTAVLVPFPSSESDQPERSSWFGSLSRAKGKDKMVKAIQNVPNMTNQSHAQVGSVAIEGVRIEEASATPISPSLLVQPPTPPQLQHPREGPRSEPLPTTPQPIPSHHPVKRSWFSSSPTSPGQGVSPTTPSPLNSGSSIDEEVPSLSARTPPPTTPPAVVQTPNVNEDGTNRARLSSLNPSTSRFTLSIPLLGRPKIPLDQAVAVARAGENRGTAIEQTEKQTAVTTTTLTQTTQTATTVVVDPVLASSTDVLQSAPVTESTATPSAGDSREKQATTTSSSSWWDYVGWGTTGAVPPPLTDSEKSLDDPNRAASPPGSDIPSVRPPPTTSSEPSTTLPPSDLAQRPQLTPSHPTESTGLITEPTANGNASNNKDLTPESKYPRAASILSTETSQSQGSAWYSPWAWYGAAASSTALPAGEPVTLSGSTKTRSELIKEEALARAEEPSAAAVVEVPDAATVSTPETTPPQEASNPIESTITMNRSGWASFFSSKSLIVKRVSGTETQRDENGMEVMDLDDDADSSPIVDQGNAEAAAMIPPKGKDRGKQLAEHPNQPQKDKTALRSPLTSPQKSETPPSRPVAPPLTISDSVKRETQKTVAANAGRKPASPAASKKSGANTPVPRTPPPNLVLPTWQDTFHAVPRNLVPPPPTSKFTKTIKFVSGVLFAKDEIGAGKGKAREKARENDFSHFGKELPRAWDVVGDKLHPDVLNGCSNVVVIGIHGWFPGAVMRTVLGEPTGTSSKFVNMMVQALEDFQEKHDVKFKKITTIPLEGEGTIDRRVEKLYTSMISNKEWMDDLHAADAIFVATHSQGSIVSTHLLDRLIYDRHIRTIRNEASDGADSFAADGVSVVPTLRPQKICCLALCGIHLGPLRYLSTSSLLQPYIQYFESTAARELFDFQNTESQVSKAYVKALRNVVDNGTKMVFVASLNDQVVPIYSGLFTSVSHPLILRALYIDGDAYHSSDFLSNLLVLLLRVLNSGLSDSGLLAHLSEATAGSLNGVGHSTAYEELATYSLAVKYLFLTDNGLEEHSELTAEPFNATSEQNDYEIPWALRDLVADERVAHFFSREISELRDAFREWQPKTTILRDIKRKLQPIQRLPSSVTSGSSSSVSKL